MASIAVIGTGYVGLTTGVCFSHLGHDVICADVVPEKVEQLQRGESPIFEAGLDELLREGIQSGRLQFVLGAANAVGDAEFVYLCVPTPQASDGSANMSYIEAAAREIAPVLQPDTVVVNKSTVPVGSTRLVERALGRSDVFVVSNPEFLREGSAVSDFLKPDRVVIGSDHQNAAIRVASLYIGVPAPLMVTDPASAETIKYASNAFLATKLSFVNAVAAVCEAVGADVNDVVLGMGYDKRIGQEFLRPGPGFGGSCFLGDETVLVRRGDQVRLMTFAALGADIADVGVVGLEVLAWMVGEPEPAFFPISAVTQRRYDGDIVEVRTEMGRRIWVTADHPFVVNDGVDGERVEVKLAHELGVSDWLPVAQGRPTPDDSGMQIRMLDELQAAGIGRADGIERSSDRRHGTSVPQSIEVDDDFWRLLGLYLANGHLSVDGRRHRITWSFHPFQQEDLVGFVAEYWRRQGVRVDVRAQTTTRQVTVSSRILASVFTEQLRLGRDCATKRVPDQVWSRPDAERKALLRGLWDGGGSWSLVAGGPSVVFEYATVSRELADGMLRLLGDLGIMATLKVGRASTSTVDTYWLAIAGADQIERALFLFPEDEQHDITRAISGQAKRTRPPGYRRLGKGAAWVRVVDTTSRPFDGVVYSVEVPGPHTVVSSFGLIAHNCFPKDTRAMLRIAEDGGYDFNLLKGVLAVNDEQFELTTQKIVDMAGGSVDGRKIAVWGLTFKANTDDLRDSPALEISRRLHERGASIHGYDPAVSDALADHPYVTVEGDPYGPCEGAAVLAVLTEWDEFKWLDLDKVAAALEAPRVVDARNLLDRSALVRRGFAYQGIGRK